MNSSRLDNLPVELIRELLGYFSAHEIFYSLMSVTSYIDTILATYENYQVNFKAITRRNFDLVCRHLMPDQVIALTLSDDGDTPGLIGLFLSRFQIRQFTRLHALTLHDIGADFWETIITQMVTLENLRSFFYYPSNRDNPWVCNLSSSQVTELDRSLADMYAPILPRLFRLRLSHADFLSEISFPYLRHLVLERSTIGLIEHISSAAPNLKLLDTSFSLYWSHTEMLHIPPQLNHLILRIQDSSVSMNLIEQMMSNLPHLRHFELKADGGIDIIDGQRWERIAKNLSTFQFKFSIPHAIEAQQLDSFRTPFWLNEKQWFVAYADKRFFSVPHFLPRKVDGDDRSPQYTTVPDIEIFYRHIDELTLTKDVINGDVFYPHIDTLTLRYSPSIQKIRKAIECRHIRNLSLSSIGEQFPIKYLITEMPNLSELTLANGIENFLKNFRYKSLEKIQTLRISYSMLSSEEYNIGQLCTVFPKIKQLHVNHLCSLEQIFKFLHRLKYLSNASFYCIAWNSNDQKTCRGKIQFRMDQIQHRQALDFTYRFDTARIFFWFSLQANRRLT